MSESNDAPKSGAPGNFTRGFSQWGASLRQQAQDLTQKTAAQLNEMNHKVQDKVAARKAEDEGDGNLSSATASKLDQYSKEQLVEVLQKMNKRVKQLTAREQQIQTQWQKTQEERERLMGLVRDEILNGTVDLKEDQDTVVQLQAAWRQVDEQNALNLQQLQTEFARLQRQQVSEEDGKGSSWEKEKNDLEQAHEQELLQLKESLLEQHAREIELLKKESSGTGNGEVEKVKEAAEARFQAAKKKFAIVHKHEVEKVRAQLQEEAQKVLETKLAEQSQHFQSQIAELQHQLAERQQQDDSFPVSQLEELKTAHAAELDKVRTEAAEKLATEIEKTRQEVEQTVTSEMEEKLQELLGEAERKHHEEKEKIEMDVSQQISSAGNQASELEQRAMDAEKKVASLEQEMAELRRSYEETLQSLRFELSSVVESKNSTEQQASKEIEEELQSLKAEKEAELDKIRLGLEESHASELEALRQRLLSEKEDLRREMQQKLDDLVQNADNAASSEHKIEIESLQEQFDAKLEKERQLWEKEKFRAIEETRKQVESSWNEEYSSKLTEIEGLRKKIHENEMRSSQLDAEYRQEVKIRDETIANLNVEFNNLKEEIMVNRSASGKSDSALQEEVEALKTQLQSVRNSYSDEITALKKDYEKVQADARVKIQERDEEISRITSMVDDFRRINGDLESSNKNLKEQYEELMEKYNSASSACKQLEATQSEYQQLNQSFYDAKNELQRIQEENAAVVASLEDKYREEGIRFRREIASLNASLEESKKELDGYRSGQSEEVQELRTQLDTATQRIETMKNDHVDELQRLRSLLETEANAKLGNQLTEMTNKLRLEKEEEVRNIQVKYEEKLNAATAQHDELSQKFNKLKSMLSQRLKDVEEENSVRIERLEKEKVALEETLKSKEEKLMEVEHRSATERQLFEEKVHAIEDQISIEKSELNAQIVGEQEKLKKLEEDYEVRILQMKKDVATAQEAAAEARESSVGPAVEELEKKLNETEAKLSEALVKAESDREKALANLKQEYDEYRSQVESERDSLRKERDDLFKQKREDISKFNAEKEEMRKKMELYVDEMTGKFKAKLQSTQDKAKAEKERLQKMNEDLNERVEYLTEKVTELDASASTLRDQNLGLEGKLKNEISTQNMLREQLSNLRRELEEASATNSATASDFLRQQETLEKEKKNLIEQVRALKVERETQTNKIDELSSKLAALSTNMDEMAKERNALEEKVEDAAKQEKKLKASEEEIADLREQINKLKLEVTRSATLANRLQAEKEANERSHGQRTAIVGMLENQLAELNDKNSEINAKLEASLYDLSQKDDIIQNFEEEISKLQKRLDEATLENKRATDALAAAQKGADAKSLKMIESLQKEVQAVKQQMAKKSSAAQRLLQEREAECADLKKKNQLLQQEVDKGSVSDRRIFELAEKQSNRESHQLTEIEIRDKIIQRLRETLLDRDGELASSEKEFKELELQVQELYRIRRRNSVDVDYLKGVVVQYLALPPGTDERARLLPVLATLLQFNQDDYKTIEAGKGKVSWWGSVAPTYIAAPSYFSGSTTSPAVSNSGSAEVSVSRDSASAKDNSKRTSLQF